MSDISKKLTETVSTAAMSGMGPVELPGNGTLGSGDVPAGSGDAEEEYKKKKKRMKHLKTLESFISEGVNLKQSHLSSEDYQKAKKLKGFDEADWEWNGDKGLYSKVNESRVDKTSDQDRIYYDFLLTLRDSGKTNMFGAAPYLQKEFDLSKSEARNVLAEWMKSFNESKVNEADAQKPRGIDQFAEDMESDKMNPEIHLATFSGKSFKAQSTDKTWEDGVPVTKNFTRGGYKSTSPKGEHYIIETDRFWYFVIGRMWFAVKRADYGTPPFEY